MHKLIRGAHFAVAFLMGILILIPVYLGAAELPSYSKYSGPIKPGVTINKDNIDTYMPELQKLLPAAKLKYLAGGVKKGLITIPVIKNTFVPPAKNLMDATRKHAGAARVGADNQLQGWVAGYPFLEPKTAQEVAWNCNPTISRASSGDDMVFFAQFFLFQGSKYEKSFTWDLYDRKYRGRTEMAPLGEMDESKEKGVIFKESFVVSEPQEVKGFMQLRTRFWDVNKADEVYAYIPALRRVRRLTGADVTDPLLGSDAISDDFEVWRQKLTSRMKLRALEHRDFLVPKTYVGFKNKPPYDPKKTGPYVQCEWEVRPLWVLELMINDPEYVYSKRVLYVDAVPLADGGCSLLYWGEQFDQKGQLWKANGYLVPSGSDVGLKSMYSWVYINHMTDHYTELDGYPAYVKGYEGTFPLKEEESFSIKGLLKQAQAGGRR